MSCGQEVQIYSFPEDNYDDTEIVKRIEQIEASYEELQEAIENTIEVIQLCEPGNEVLLHLYDGSYIAYFESGSKRYLSVLTEGSYITTDVERCRFSIENGEVYYE